VDGVDDLGVVDVLEVERGDAKVAVPELALDDESAGRLRGPSRPRARGEVGAPGGPGEDFSGGFEQGGWDGRVLDEQVERAMGEWMSKPFDLVLGRKIYENGRSTCPRTPRTGCATAVRSTSCPRRGSPPIVDFAAMARCTRQRRHGGEKWEQYTCTSS